LLTVDSSGHLYVYDFPEGKLFRFDPTTYNPVVGQIEYGDPPVTVFSTFLIFGGLAINPADDHVYLHSQGSLWELGPATDGEPNELLDEWSRSDGDFDVGGLAGQIALDSERNRLYVTESASSGQAGKVAVLKLDAPQERLMTIDEAGGSPFVRDAALAIAVDERNGHLFVVDRDANRYSEFDEDGTFLGFIKRPPTIETGFTIYPTVDDSELSPSAGYLYVPSENGHLFAYEPAAEGKPPVVESISFTGVTEAEAVLRATINPKFDSTHWTIEYTTQQKFEEEGGFAGAQLAGEGTISPGDRGVLVSAPATGLSPGTAYRFRVRAESLCEPGGCADEKAGLFATFAQPPAQSGTCPNQVFRTGPSAALPDCRVYELATPADTGGNAPVPPAGAKAGPTFVTPPASPGGDSLAFAIQGGLIPGYDGGNGALYGDNYVSRRSASGWQTQVLGPSGAQATYTNPGGLSADHSYFAVEVDRQGTLVVNDGHTEYVRYPDGSFRFPGAGSLATALDVNTHYIAAAGGHLLFSTAADNLAYRLQLEPTAPPDGTVAIYDLTPLGLQVVSLLPGEVTPAAGQNASFVGNSADGAAVAFTVGAGSPLYLRVDDAETLTAAPAGVEFAGMSADGRYLFYMEGGDLYRFDASTQATDPITTSGDIEPVNIGSEGSGGYFLSPSVLAGANALGDEAQAGEQNLYHWDGDGTDFVATVTDRDAKGEVGSGGEVLDGLGLWMDVQKSRSSQIALSSRTSADGSVLAFESRANLTGFQSSGKAEVFRYDGALACVSCDPTAATPAGDASVSPPLDTEGEESNFNRRAEIPTLSNDGDRVFFETPERLVVGDNDGVVDVYQWESEGKGTCAQPGGCLSLISSGQSTRDNHIFGVSRSGDDVFVLTADLLSSADSDETPSVYDARVGGGFAPPVPPAAECLGEACQPGATAPNDPSIEVSETAGNVKPSHRPACPKGKRRVRKAGKVRCVRPHRKHQQHRKQSPKRRAQR
jgi:hypothetical protein